MPRERPWARIVAQLRAAVDSTDRLLVVGEDGVGKRAALRATLADSGRGYREIDCAAVDELGCEEWLHQARVMIDDPAGLVVLAHLDMLSSRDARALASILERATRSVGIGLHVAGTVSASAYAEHAIPRALTDQFAPDAFEVEPLRKRPEDALARLVDQGVGMPTLNREAVQMVQRHPWPGNHRQLEEFRRWMARQDRPVLVPDDLPSSWRNELTRGNLTSMQMAESDAIVAALRHARGNKAAAATALGISRSSLYRKMREYHLR